jgi:2OG-Fe(II) oxygenase superfamily
MKSVTTRAVKAGNTYVPPASCVARPTMVRGLPASIEEWAALGTALRPAYAAGKPWPHLVCDGFFDRELLEKAAAEGRGTSLPGLQPTRNTTVIKDESATPPGPACAMIMDVLDGPGYCAFLSALTGLTGLRYDPEHYNATLHITPPGGGSRIHLDFRVHPTSGLHPRVTSLIYLNEGWRLEEGGILELWDPSMRGDPATVVPEMGRMVIFETHGGTPHGLPDPVRRSEGRVSLCAFYYSEEPAPRPRGRYAIGARPRRHGEPWRAAFPDRSEVVLAIWARAPKFLQRPLHRLK